MELLRQFDFDALENALAALYRDGMKENEVAASFKAYLMGNENGQARWLTMVDSFYLMAMEEKDEAEQTFLIGQAHDILRACNAVM